MKGKCGVCGDPYMGRKLHEAGGKYATGTIAKTYKMGQIIEAKVDITANHKGYFQFKICPNNNPKKRVTQECLDRYPLMAMDVGNYMYQLPSTRNKMYKVKLQLPQGLVCTQCVLQWVYTSGKLCLIPSYILNLILLTWKEYHDSALSQARAISTMIWKNMYTLLSPYRPRWRVLWSNRLLRRCTSWGVWACDNWADSAWSTGGNSACLDDWCQQSCGCGDFLQNFDFKGCQGISARLKYIFLLLTLLDKLYLSTFRLT